MHDDKYEKLAAVELSKLTSDLEDAYRNAFEDRYGVQPIISDEDRQILRWARQTLKHRARPVLEHYVRMDNEWFVKNTHSLRIFKKNINDVNTAAVDKKPARSLASDVRVSMPMLCDYCPPGRQNYVEIVCRPNEVDTVKRQCERCRDEGRNTRIPHDRNDFLKSLDKIAERNPVHAGRALRQYLADNLDEK